MFNVQETKYKVQEAKYKIEEARIRLDRAYVRSTLGVYQSPHLQEAQAIALPV